MKKEIYIYFIIIVSVIISLSFKLNCHEKTALSNSNLSSNFNFNAKTIENRFLCPEGFSREKADSNSFDFFLRNLNLKDSGEKVKLYNGNEKHASDVYCSVVSLSIGNKDLHQCADAVMRLRADYLYKLKRYNEIRFQLVSGKWLNYQNFVQNDYTYPKYWKYLEQVFSYANTASLKKQLKTKNFKDINIGDVFVQSGNPYGHAVIVVDICKNKQGEKQFILAQSYMPAQEIQILYNPLKTNEVWYSSKEISNIVNTPEWIFNISDLKTW